MRPISSVRMAFAAVFSLILFWCAPCNFVLVKSVDTWINVTLTGTDIATIEPARFNSTEFLQRLNAYAQQDMATYQYLLGAAVVSFGTDLFANSVLPTLCPVNSYINTASGLCMSCAAGTYSETPLSMSVRDCIACAAGTFSSAAGASNRSACLTCPDGTFSSVVGANTSLVCQDCGEGATSVKGAQSVASCVCKDGYYLSGSR